MVQQLSGVSPQQDKNESQLGDVDGHAQHEQHPARFKDGPVIQGLASTPDLLALRLCASLSANQRAQLIIIHRVEGCLFVEVIQGHLRPVRSLRAEYDASMAESNPETVEIEPSFYMLAALVVGMYFPSGDTAS